MEASALQAPASLPRTPAAMTSPLLRFRSDDQLVAMFRAGHDDAFRVIHDRYHKRLFAYARQMLPGRQDAEDALQDVFVRAYSGLRASDQQLALRAWLFRVAHNRCVDELRRPAPPPPEVFQLVRTAVQDPLTEVDLRESLRRLIEDIRRLPEQQRSALLMRELGGMSYADLAASLGVSVGAVKSLLVRARVALAQAADARDTSCLLIREQLVEAHDRGLRPGATARKHMRDCVACKSFRRELRGMSRQLAAIGPAVGPLGILAKAVGLSGGAGGGAAGGGGLALLGGGGASASAGGVAVGVNHLATLLVAAAATAGGAVEIQHNIISLPHHSAPAHVAATDRPHATSHVADRASATGLQAIAGAVEATVSTAPKLAQSADQPGARHLKVQLNHKLWAGGSTSTTGAAGLTGTSSTDAKSPKTGAAGFQDGSSSTSSPGTACTTGTASAAVPAGTAPASVPVSAPGQPPSTPVTPTAPLPCVAPGTPSSGAASSPTTAGSSSGGGQSDGTTTSSSSTGSYGSTPGSGTGSGATPPSTGSSGGQAPTYK